MWREMSKAPTLNDLNKGWVTKDTMGINKTFKTHGRLLLLLLKLEVIPIRHYHILCSDFQSKTFDKIRDGE